MSDVVNKVEEINYANRPIKKAMQGLLWVVIVLSALAGLSLLIDTSTFMNEIITEYLTIPFTVDRPFMDFAGSPNPQPPH